MTDEPAAIPLLRSALYMPGSNARALEKARGLPADAVILDLEDAVAPEAKESAREAVAAAVKAGGFGRRTVAIRINALDTPWGEADLAMAAKAAPDAVVVPKVGAPDDLVAVGSRLRRLGAPVRTRVWAMVETPLAILRAEAIASASHDVDARLDVLVMGTNDLAKEGRLRLGVPGRPALMPWLMTALAAARAHDLVVLDGVYNAVGDAESFEAECRQGRDAGFDGKTLIHPSQLDAANRHFAPDPEEVAQARAILAAFDREENRGRGAIALDGRMVERLHAQMARRTVALADAIAAADAA